MAFSENQIKEAEEVDIVSFCQNNGVGLTNESERYFRLAEHDSLVIDRQKNRFTWNSRNVSGNVINFVQDVYLGKRDFKKAVQLLLDKEMDFKSQTDIEFVHEPYEYKNRESSDRSHMETYLNEVRGISKQTIKEFEDSGILVEDEFHNAVFKWLGTNRNDIVGASEQGTRISYEIYGKRGTRKIIQRDSTTNFGMNYQIGEARNLKFFESSIDTMSYRDLHPDLQDTLLVSMEGLKQNVINNYLISNIKSRQAAPDSIEICVDNDAAGQHFYDDLAKVEYTCKYDGKDVRFENGIPSEVGCKDYNDVLKYHNQQLELADKEKESEYRALTPPGMDQNNVSKTEVKTEDWKKQLVENAENEILKLTDSHQFKQYLKTLSSFHSYSARNVALIYSQMPGATRVAGFKQWQKDFGRKITKGEKSIRIAAPIIKNLSDEEKIKLNTTEEKAVVNYRYIPVFDISQTNGDPLPTAHDFVKANLKDHKNVTAMYEALKKYINTKTNISVSEQIISKGSVKGLFRPSTNQIVISCEEQDSALKLKTLYHEYAHSQLHGLTSEFKDRPRAYQEAQAESVAYVAMTNIGVDTSEYSLGYVATWAKDKAVIHSALGEIQQVSNKVIEISDELTNELNLQVENDKQVTNERGQEGTSFFVQEGKNNMTKETFYHGSTHKFNQFDINHLGENGTAQGAGIYVTPDKEAASMYAQINDDPGYVYKVSANLKKPLSLDKVTISDQKLSKIIDQIHEKTDLLSNYGDVDYSGYSEVKEEAIELLRENNNDVDLYNDLASAAGDQQITAEAFEDIGDYTHVVSHDQTRLNSDVYTVLNANNVTIDECDEYSPDAKISKKKLTHLTTAQLLAAKKNNEIGIER